MWARVALSFWKKLSRSWSLRVRSWSKVRLIRTNTRNSRSRLTSLSQPQTAEKRIEAVDIAEIHIAFP